jgi:hypothetical protein
MLSAASAATAAVAAAAAACSGDLQIGGAATAA